MDHWTLKSPEIEVGLKQFGEPKGAFGMSFYITGSNEANEALKQQAVYAANMEAALKQRTQDTVRASLPPFLSLEKLELEPIPTGTCDIKINFKVTVIPREDLFQVDREVKGSPPVTLLKVVQAAGTKTTLDGSVVAHRKTDQCSLETPEFQAGLKQFGQTKATFGEQFYVAGSKEANEAQVLQAANAAKFQKAIDDATAAAKTAEDARKAEAEAKRQALILATLPGTRYTGTISMSADGGGKLQRINLIFTEQKDPLIRADVNNPNDPKQKQSFTGNLTANSSPENNAAAGYPITMSSLSKTHELIADRFKHFYVCEEVLLRLRLTDNGLEGWAEMKSNMWMGREILTISLQREESPVARPPATAPTTPKSP